MQQRTALRIRIAANLSLAAIFGLPWAIFNQGVGNLSLASHWFPADGTMYTEALFWFVSAFLILLSFGLFVYQVEGWLIDAAPEFHANQRLLNVLIVVVTGIDIVAPAAGYYLWRGWPVEEISANLLHVAEAVAVAGVFGSIICQYLATEFAIEAMRAWRALRDAPAMRDDDDKDDTRPVARPALPVAAPAPPARGTVKKNLISAATRGALDNKGPRGVFSKEGGSADESDDDERGLPRFDRVNTSTWRRAGEEERGREQDRKRGSHEYGVDEGRANTANTGS